MRIIFLAMLSLMGAIGCSEKSTLKYVTAETINPSVKGARVAHVVLPNGLKVLAISGAATEDAKIAVSVGVGSYSNPPEHPGLAHFVEHMLFLGNAQYPDPSEYMNFVRRVGGVHNAFTATDLTTYFVQTPSASFPEAVQRISRFFVSPTFDEQYVAKEKNAVHNEYLRRLDSDQISRAMGAFYSSDSPFQKFTVGSLESLANTTATDARHFFETYYSAPRMAIVVMGPQSTEDLVALVRSHFSDVPDRGLAPVAETPEVDPTRLNKIVRVVNENASNSLLFNIHAPQSEPNPGLRGLMAALLGTEGEGSLVSSLQRQGLAVPQSGAISAGATEDGFMFRVRLTPEGVENYRHVIATIKGYLEFLKRSPFPDYMVNQINSLNRARELETDYSKLPVYAVANLAGQLLHANDWQQLFVAASLNQIGADTYFSHLNANSADSFYGVLSDNRRATKTLASLGTLVPAFSESTKLLQANVMGQDYLLDGYYNGAYEILPVDMKAIVPTSDVQFRLPERNEYIPEKFEMLPLVFEVLAPIVGANIEIHLNPGAGVLLPKAYFSALAFSPNFDKTDKRQMSQLILLKNWLMSSLQEELYPFEEAGFSADLSVQPTYGGLMLSFNGWTDNYDKAVEDYIARLNFSEDEVAFERFKHQQLLSLERSAKSPQHQLQEAFIQKYTPDYPTLSSQVQILQTTTFAEIRSLYLRFFETLYFQGVLSGNISQDMGRKISAALQEKWPAKAVVNKASLEALKQVNFGSVNDKIVIEISANQNQNSYVSQFYQFGSQSPKEEVMAQILGAWIGADFYNELRTQQQIAYSLGAMAANQGSYYGLSFYVESGTHGGDDVAVRVQNFIINWVDKTLPLKTTADLAVQIDEIKKTKNQNSSVSHYDAMEKYLYPPTGLAEEAGMYDINIEEMLIFARLKLLESPQGVFVKVKSVKDPVSPIETPVAQSLLN